MVVTDDGVAECLMDFVKSVSYDSRTKRADMELLGDVRAGVLDNDCLTSTERHVMPKCIRCCLNISVELGSECTGVYFKVYETTGRLDRPKERSGCVDGINDAGCHIRGWLAKFFCDGKDGECEVSELTLLWLCKLDTSGRCNPCRRDEVPCAAPQQIISI